MNLNKITAVTGVSGFIASLTVEQMNAYAGFTIACLTILTLIPLAILRWQTFIRFELNKNQPTNQDEKE